MMNFPHSYTYLANKQSGFTLLEVLIALVVLAIGLLGLAGMQAIGIKNNHSAYHRSQATQVAYDIADRMRANTVGVDNYLTSFMLPSVATNQNGCTAGGCSSTQMAEDDLYEWNLTITDTLPSGVGTITISGLIYTISITWDDNRDGAVDASDPDFQVSFQP